MAISPSSVAKPSGGISIRIRLVRPLSPTGKVMIQPSSARWLSRGVGRTVWICRPRSIDPRSRRSPQFDLFCLLGKWTTKAEGESP